MAQKPQKKQTKKVYRSIEEVKERFFPYSYLIELEQKKSLDTIKFGTSIVQDFLNEATQQLRK